MNRRSNVHSRQKTVELNDENKQIFKRLLKYVFKKYKWHYLISIILIFISTGTELYSTMFLKTLLDDYVIPMLNTSNPDFAPLARALTVVGAILIVGVIATYARNLLTIKITHGTILDIRSDLFKHMQSLPISYFDQREYGDIMSVYTNDVDTLREMLDQSIPQLVIGVITVIGTLIAMLVMSPQLTGLTIVNVAIILLISRFFIGKSSVYFGRQQKAIGDMNGYIEEMISGLQVVKVFNYEERSLEDFEEINENLRDVSSTANGNAMMIMPMNGQLGNLSYVSCALIGSIIAMNGAWGLTLGSLVSFLSLNKSFYRPVNQMSSQLNSLIQAIAGSGRILDLLDEKPEVDNGEITLTRATVDQEGKIIPKKTYTSRWAWEDCRDNKTCQYTEVEGSIEFNNVDFSYVKGEQILYDINLYGLPGQKIAFVGSTGAGKTTITNLINRFYEIDSGEITYDGYSVSDIKKADLRKSLGIVLQDVNLFSGTIMENIRYGNLDATDEECKVAAKLAKAHDFIERLPQGYDTYISGSRSSLSEGQRQLLSIARVAVANPPVLILDEATSSIDTRTERLVSSGMDALMSGRTTFVIAHRLSTIKNSDVIMVMEDGKIIERGNHTQLLEKKGRYYKLYTGKDN